jgi:hypothetical protein
METNKIRLGTRYKVPVPCLALIRMYGTIKQCCGSGSGFNGVPGSVSGSGRAKMTHKGRKKFRIFMLWSAGCSLLRDEGFFYSSEVLYGALGISKLSFLINKKITFNFKFLGHPKSWIRIWICIQSKCWIRIK